MAPPTPCCLLRWLSNPSASHRTPPDRPAPGQTNCPSPTKGRASFCTVRLRKAGRLDSTTASSSTPPSHQRQRHLISHHIRLAESSPFTLRLFWRREVGSVWLVDFPTNVFVFRKDGQAFSYIDGTVCFYLGADPAGQGNGPGMSRDWRFFRGHTYPRYGRDGMDVDACER